MNSVNLSNNVCRICLEDEANINWNDEIIGFSGSSYKYCYFKYTHMEETDADYYPTNLCDKCASEVKNAHTLFEKASESFIILQNTIKTKAYESLYADSNHDFQKVSCEFKNNNFKESKYSTNPYSETDDLISYSPANDDSMDGTEISLVNRREILTSPNINSNYPKTSFGRSLERRSLDTFNIEKIIKPKMPKNKKFEAYTTAVELNLELEISSSKLLKSNVNTSAKKTSISDASLKKTQSTEFSSQSSISKVTSANTKSQQSSSTKQSDLKSDESDTSYCSDYFSSLRLKQGETPPFINIENEETPKQNLAEDEISSESFSKSNFSISKDSEISSASDGNIEKSNDAFKPSEISLLKRIYGKHFDINSLKKKPNSKQSQPKEKMCQYCSLTFVGTNLLRHEATHLEHRERKAVCPKCGIKLYTKMSLSEHMKIHDENRQKQHKCEFCEKAFFHKGALNVHRRIHLGLTVKCQICSKEYYRQIDLERHLSSHSASPLQNKATKMVKYTVQCQYCNKSVRTINWKSHKAAHLKQPQVKCKICNKDFYSRHSCGNHLQRVHHKAASECAEHIHFYVDSIPRMSNLIIRQQEIVVEANK